MPNIRRQRNTGMWLAAELTRSQSDPRSVFNRTRFIDDLIHERRVGAVFQQAAHQVGEQRLMRTNRCIDTARLIQIVFADT
jgi:hypothetical protein